MESESKPFKDGYNGMTVEGNKQQMLESNDQIDRLSLLPDTILEDILSLIPLKSAAATSILSRRWRYIWTGITHLVFDLCFLPSSFSNSDLYAGGLSFANHIIPQLTSAKIYSFCLEIPWVTWEREDCHSLEPWMGTVCDRHVEQIEVVNASTSITVPTCILQCQSLAKFALKGAIIIEVPDCGLAVALPNLKKLDLCLPVLNTELLAKLFQSCLLLEELTLSGEFSVGGICLDLPAHNLKQFVLQVFAYTLQGLTFVINLSKLEKIRLCAVSLAFFRFVKYSGALISADICVGIGGSVDLDLSHTAVLLQLNSNLRSLCINISILQALVLNAGRLPMMKNLTDLSIESGLDDVQCSWNDVLLALRHSPNILVLLIEFGSNMSLIKWASPQIATPRCFTKLKRIEMKNLHDCNVRDTKVMAYILKNASALEVLSVFFAGGMEKELKLYETLINLKRSSLMCEIQFFGKYVTASE